MIKFTEVIEVVGLYQKGDSVSIRELFFQSEVGAENFDVVSGEHCFDYIAIHSFRKNLTLMIVVYKMHRQLAAETGLVKQHSLAAITIETQIRMKRQNENFKTKVAVISSSGIV
jgi:hypothetical protein